MWSSEVTNMIITGIWETLYMTLVSTLVGYVIGLPSGVSITDRDSAKTATANCS
jgi:D-methionine transport system permease protein